MTRRTQWTWTRRMAMAAAVTVAAFGELGCIQEVPLGGRCGSSNCRGCCDAQGMCQLGLSSNLCGSNGGMCLDCQGQQCAAGRCQGAGGGGAGGAGGGGSGGGGGVGGGSGAGGGSGGGVGRIDQELVSGSRLRAILHAGPDGARAPTLPILFWDSQLLTYCYPGRSPAACHPTSAISGVRLTSGEYRQYGFSDPSCTLPIADVGEGIDGAQYSRDLIAAGLPPIEAKFVQRTTFLRDGGYGTSDYLPAAPYAGDVYFTEDVATDAGKIAGPCVRIGETNAARTLHLHATTLQPATLAPMPLIRE